MKVPFSIPQKATSKVLVSGFEASLSPVEHPAANRSELKATRDSERRTTNSLTTFEFWQAAVNPG